jgi:DNA-binding MarR family transcriptional regulator
MDIFAFCLCCAPESGRVTFEFPVEDEPVSDERLDVSISDSSKHETATSFDIGRSVVHLLHRADQCTAEAFMLALAHRDLTPRQFAVLVAVAARESATQTTITDDTGIDRSTMVDVVRRLMKRGLLQRRRSRSDARAYIVRLTDEGRRVVQAAGPEAVQVDKAIMTALAPEERDVFVEALGRVVATLAVTLEQTRAKSSSVSPTPPLDISTGPRLETGSRNR